MFGSLIGAAIAVPMIHQANPELLGRFLTRAEPQPAAQQLAYAEPKPRQNAPASSGSVVTVPMDARGHFVTDFKFNGQKVKALIDTGATYVALNRSTAGRIGARISAQDMRYTVSTANGEARAAAITIEEVTIGRIRVRNVPALVLEDKALDGVLMGMSFLKELDRFAIEDRTLILEN
ncbi:MAG: TIGR02281 family clan AA aspartic protease [Rhizobiaceae bacterium]|nr:TIGR02281 family clan AA aspartic protease [Rhizobiaceae bacterium]